MREYLRQRAKGRCEYCCIPEHFTTFRFQMDHVVAKKHRGGSSLENLAWACADCNSYKGTDLTGIDPETGRIERLFNPRTDDWNDHFSWEGPILRTKTPIGRVTVILLKINLEQRIAARRELIAAGLFSTSNS